MSSWFDSHLNSLFQSYGYWTVFMGLLLESTGLPLPGETILIAATVLAVTRHELSVPYIASIAIVGAATGDNLGFVIGRYGGCRLLKRYSRTFHIKDELIQQGQNLFSRHGKAAVFLARFIAGLRMLAGPLAGVLGMRWIPFAVFNALGAICWVLIVVSLAYFLGPSISILIRHATWVLLGFGVLGFAYWWWKRRRS